MNISLSPTRICERKRAQRRLRKEWNDIERHPVMHCSIAPIAPINEQDILIWKGTIEGSSDTTFDITIEFPDSYPFKPPKFTYSRNITRYNVFTKGELDCTILCCDSDGLSDDTASDGLNWSPSFNISKLLSSAKKALNMDNFKPMVANTSCRKYQQVISMLQHELNQTKTQLNKIRKQQINFKLQIEQLKKENSAKKQPISYFPPPQPLTYHHHKSHVITNNYNHNNVISSYMNPNIKIQSIKPIKNSIKNNIKSIQQNINSIQHSTAIKTQPITNKNKCIVKNKTPQSVHKNIWQWQNDNGQWIAYKQRIHKTFDALKIGALMEFSMGNHNYTLHKISNTLGQQINIKTKKKRAAQKVTVQKQHDLLQNFDPVDHDHKEQQNEQIVLNYTTPKLFDIRLASDISGEIMNKFYESVNKNQFEVTKITKVQNEYLWDKYCAARQNMIKMIGMDNINEQNLWHGSHCDIIRIITKQGFRKEFNKRNRFGEGTYFAKMANISIHYCKSNVFEYKMLYCKVLCGASCHGDKTIKLQNWPEMNGDGQNGQIYDSLVNYKLNPTVYVIHDDVRAYPMFIVHFIKVC